MFIIEHNTGKMVLPF